MKDRERGGQWAPEPKKKTAPRSLKRSHNAVLSPRTAYPVAPGKQYLTLSALQVLGLFAEPPELEAFARNGFLDGLPRELVGRGPLRRYTPRHRPGAMLLRELAPARVAGKSLQLPPRLGLE